jgi:MoxR-like ATPase
VLPDDEKMVASPVLNHRMILRPESRLRKITTDQVVSQLISEIAVPVIGNQ